MQDFDLRVLKALAVGLESVDAIAVAMGCGPASAEDALTSLSRFGLAAPLGLVDGRFKITPAGRACAAMVAV